VKLFDSIYLFLVEIRSSETLFEKARFAWLLAGPTYDVPHSPIGQQCLRVIKYYLRPLEPSPCINPIPDEDNHHHSPIHHTRPIHEIRARSFNRRET
jgi:hypothetical protein